MIVGLAAFAALLWAAIHWSFIRFPPNTMPWQTVRLDAPQRWLAHYQIFRLAHDRQACVSALNAASQLSFTPLRDRRIDNKCGYTNVVRADRSPIAFNYDPVATCELSAALYWWERALQTLAVRQLHSRIVRIDQLGTFACRNVNSDPDGSRSQHATANAIDVEAFKLADGRRISVLRDWGKPTAAGRFLAAAHDAACGVFNGVLGPDYNRLHATHFHLDQGPYLICR